MNAATARHIVLSYSTDETHHVTEYPAEQLAKAKLDAAHIAGYEGRESVSLKWAEGARAKMARFIEEDV